MTAKSSWTSSCNVNGMISLVYPNVALSFAVRNHASLWTYWAQMVSFESAFLIFEVSMQLHITLANRPLSFV